jgi:uncharacterized protein YjbJ (UPF0337 family)
LRTTTLQQKLYKIGVPPRLPQRRIALSASSDIDGTIVASGAARDGYGTAVSEILRTKLNPGAWTQLHARSYWMRVRNQGDVMNKDQVKGRVEEAKGKVKEVTGRAVGNPNLEDRGTVEKVSGTVQKNYGDLKEDVKDAVKKQR